jgi:hypothetical protein
MHRPNVIQEAILGEWGIQVLSNDAGDAAVGLTDFLKALRAESKAFNGSPSVGQKAFMARHQ